MEQKHEAGENRQVVLDGWTYQVDLIRKMSAGPDAPRLIIPAYQPNDTACAILKTCIRAIQHHTTDVPYELWVVDNNSPRRYSSWLPDWPGINVVMSRTKPLPPERRRLYARVQFWRDQRRWGSYANAVGIELALRLIDPPSRYIMALHMDTMPCRHGWLSFLRSRLNDKVMAAGVCMEKARTPEGVLHVLGCLADLQKMKELGIDFFPQLPDRDVGDNVTLDLRAAGFEVFACPNTYENPELAEKIPVSSPLRDLRVVRAFDDDWNVVFLHLGRGIPKSDNTYTGQAASAEEWFRFAESNIMKSGPCAGE